MRDRAYFMIVDEAWPAAQTGIAGPAFEASLPELAARRYHTALLAVHAHFPVAVCFAEAVRLTRYVRKTSWRETYCCCGQRKQCHPAVVSGLVSFLCRSNASKSDRVCPPYICARIAHVKQFCFIFQKNETRKSIY